MDLPNRPGTGPGDRPARRSGWLGRVLLLLALLGAPALGALMLVGWLLFWDWGSTQVSDVPPAEVARSVAAYLVMDWDLPRPLRFEAQDPTYPARSAYYRERITGLRGLTESGGFHGDGTDWYEFEMAPDLAADLRTRLAEARSDVVARVPRPPTAGDPHAPDWWPARWPAGVICYRHAGSHAQLVLTPGGTRGWFRNFRW